MTIDLSHASDTIRTVAYYVEKGGLGDRATLLLEQDGRLLSPGLNGLSIEDKHILVPLLMSLPSQLPETAFPLTIHSTPEEIHIRLAGIQVEEGNLEIAIDNLAIIEEAALDIPAGEASSYCIGLGHHFSPQNFEAEINAKSPVEAVMKFAATKLTLGDLGEVPAASTGLMPSQYAMRTRHDWAQFDFGELYRQARQHLNGVLHQRNAAPDPGW